MTVAASGLRVCGPQHRVLVCAHAWRQPLQLDHMLRGCHMVLDAAAELYGMHCGQGTAGRRASRAVICHHLSTWTALNLSSVPFQQYSCAGLHQKLCQSPAQMCGQQRRRLMCRQPTRCWCPSCWSRRSHGKLLQTTQPCRPTPPPRHLWSGVQLEQTCDWTPLICCCLDPLFKQCHGQVTRVT